MQEVWRCEGKNVFLQSKKKNSNGTSEYLDI